MKKGILLVSGLIALSFLFISKLASQKMAPTLSNHIEWLSLEEAEKLSQNEAKPILIDVYTDWCKPCKMMDEKTFGDAEIIEFINQNYYPVKLNAEQKEEITFKGNAYKYVPNGKRGINTIVIALLGNRPAYPSLVLLDQKMSNKEVLKGFKEKEALLPILSKYVEKNLLTSK